MENKMERVTTFKIEDGIFAAMMLVCGFLYMDMVKPFHLASMGVTVFASVFCGLSFVYMKRNGKNQTKGSLAWLGIIILSAINFMIMDNASLKGLNLLFLTVTIVSWICCTCKRSLGQELSRHWIFGLFNQLFIVPFYNFNKLFQALTKVVSNHKKGRGVMTAILGLLVFTPILIIVIHLLISADAAFSAVMERLVASISENVFIYFVELIVGIPIACYLFGLLYGDINGIHTGYINRESVENGAKGIRVLPKAAVYAPMASLSIIYFVFFASQSAYLFSGFENILPEAMTYAEYARRGFFELCNISIINLLVMTGANLFIKKADATPKGLKAQNVIISGCTLLLIIAAISKMCMYIRFYGLTELRIFTTWFMCLMFFIFAVVIISQFKKINGAKFLIIIFITMFMGLCYSNVDGIIANYNIGRYEEGTLKTIDVEGLSRLSSGAIPAMVDLYLQTNDVQLKSRLLHVLTDMDDWQMATKEREANFRYFNFQKEHAKSYKVAHDIYD